VIVGLSRPREVGKPAKGGHVVGLQEDRPVFVD